MPEAYGPWQSVYARFAKWRDDGTWEAIFRALSADAGMENLSLDAACIKVRESAKSSNGFAESPLEGVFKLKGNQLFLHR